MALALAAQVQPGIVAIWVDDELEYPEQTCYIPAVCDALGVPLLVKTGTQLHGGWFRSWSMERPWRDPLPGTLITHESVRRLAPALGFGGTIRGLRQDESTVRRVVLRTRGGLTRMVWGWWTCDPLSGWSVDEVWAAIAGLDLPYNPVYDRLSEIGVPRARQRVGPLPLTDGWTLRVGWPLMYRKLVERYGQRWE